MSRLFFDHLIVFDDVEKEVNALVSTKEEKDELWGLIDELIHHRALGYVLDRLPKAHHEEFLVKFSESPHDETLMDFLKEKIGENIEELMREQLGELAFEILRDLKGEGK